MLASKVKQRQVGGVLDAPFLCEPIEARKTHNPVTQSLRDYSLPHFVGNVKVRLVAPPTCLAGLMVQELRVHGLDSYGSNSQAD